jgi:tetratricopeptide (TPR) repeat protein
MISRVSRATIAVATALMLLAAAVPAHAEWNKGLEAYKKKDWATAVKEFEEVTKTNPDYAGAYYMLGVSQRALGQLSPAIASLRKAVELDGSQASYKIALGQALLQAGQFQNAYELLKPLSMSSMDASHRSSYALLFAQAATKTNRPGEAISVLTTQARSDSKNYRLQQALGSVYTDSGDEAKAFEAFKKAFELNPRDTTSARNAVRAAISVARRSTSNQSKSNYYTQAGQIADRLASSSPTFEHQLLKSAKPNNALAGFYAAQSLTSMRRLDEALRELQASLRNGAGDDAKLRTAVYNQMGYVYDEKKQYGRAAVAYGDAGNSRKVAEMKEKESRAAQNLAADRECADFKRKIDALRLQVEELEKLGDIENAKLLQEQLPGLERQYTETCG